MKKTLLYIVSVVAIAGTVCSCNKVEIKEAGEGALQLNAYVSNTKAAMSESQLLETSKVNIYKADFTGLVRSYTYNAMPEKIYLAADEYRVDVLAGEVSKSAPDMLSWDQKSYKGSKEFTITPNNVSSVVVEAKVCNTITQVIFDPSIAGNLSEGYKLRIGFDLNSEAVATYTAENSGKQGYFLTDDVEPSLYWEFTGVRAKTGEAISKSGEIPSTIPGTIYKITPKFVVKDGTAGFDISVNYAVTEVDDLIIFEPLSSGIVESKPYEIWTSKATVHAEVDESEFTADTKVIFEHSTDGIDWTAVEATRVEMGTYKAELGGLAPETHYSYRLMVGGVQTGEVFSFTTDKATQVPNNSFEIFSNDESNNFKSFYNPSNPECPTKWWDNGNHGSTMLGASQAVCVPDTDVPNGDHETFGQYSAKCMSQYVVVKFAAGSISSCEFAGTVGTNGKVNFGRAYTTRPTAVRLWVKYKGGKINRGDYNPAGRETNDVATFIAAIGTWPSSKYKGSKACPVQVYTGDQSTLYKYNELPETIAYGYYETQGIDSWTQLTIPFEYYKYDEFPTHLVLSFAASKYGDYFTGCDSAVLWVDNVELVY